MNPNRSRRLRAVIAVFALSLAAAPLHAADIPDVLPYGVETCPATPTVRVNQTSPRIIEILGSRIKDPYIPYRVQTVSELGPTELPVAAKFIQAAMDDAEPQVRAAAARAAGQLGDKSLVADLKKLLQDKDARIRREAVLSGAALGDSSVINVGLTDDDAAVVAVAVSVATAEQAGKLAGALPSYPPATQIIALRSLGRIGDPKYGDVVASLTSASVPIRAAAAAALGQMKAAARAADVEKLLADQHPTVRREALEALHGVTTVDNLQKRAIAALADEDTSVRETAAKLLQHSPTPDAITALVSNLPADSSRLHDAAREALVAIGQPVIPTAEKMLSDTDARRRDDASYVLGELKSDASFETHLALMKDADARVVRQVAISLGRIGRKEASPALADFAQKSITYAAPTEPQTAEASSQAIEQAIVSCTLLGDTSILPTCKMLVPQPKKYAAAFRSAAVYAIGRMDTSGDKSIGGMLSHPMGDLEEASTVQFECIKAMGHLKLPAARNFVGKDRASATWVGDPRMDYLGYWVRCRLSGTAEPLEPMTDPWSATTSVTPVQD